MYHPLEFAKKHDNIRLKIFYFTLEMSAEQKLVQAICNKLYIDSNKRIRVDPKRVKSVREALDMSVMENIEGLKEHFEYFESKVTFIDSIKHPTGIFKFMEDYASTSGTTYTKNVEFKKGDKIYNHEVFDYYVPDDPEEYVILIVDHAALVTNESGLNLHETITKLSSEYFVKLRNRYNYIPVLIQQQAASQESLEHVKASLVKPTLNGLGDCKLTQRDADVIIGLFSPYRHAIKRYPEKDGYNIEFFQDNIRFMEVIASREGGGNTSCPLFFDGAVNYFKELPLPTDEVEMAKVKYFVSNNRKK